MLRRRGLLLRVLPFVVTGVIGFVVIVAESTEVSLPGLAATLVGLLALLLALLLLPWERLPHWTEVAVPVASLGLLVALRASERGVSWLAYAPLFMLALFWIALHGRRSHVAVVFAVGTVIWIGGAVADPSDDPGVRAFTPLALLVAGVVCLQTYLVVRRHREAARLYRLLVEMAPLGIAVQRRDRIVYANEALARILMRPRKELIGRSLWELAHFEDRSWRGGRAELATDIRFTRGDGSETVAETRTVPSLFEEQPAEVVMLRDVSTEHQLRRVEEETILAVQAERAQLHVILDRLEDGVALLDSERRSLHSNLALAKMFGIPRESLVGMPRDQIGDLLASLSDDPETTKKRFIKLVISGGSAIDDFELARPVPRFMRRVVWPTRLGDKDGYVVVWRDVTVVKQAIALRDLQAVTDQLTALPNRRGAEAAFVRMRARSAGRTVCVALFDIDHFKRVNDTHGHGVGDEVLRQVAKVLTAESRAGGNGGRQAAEAPTFVARWGGEEFVALIEGQLQDGRGFCERVRLAVEGLDLPAVGRVTLSAGVVEHVAPEPIEVAITRADERLYDAKHSGRNCVR